MLVKNGWYWLSNDYHRMFNIDCLQLRGRITYKTRRTTFSRASDRYKECRQRASHLFAASFEAVG